MTPGRPDWPLPPVPHLAGRAHALAVGVWQQAHTSLLAHDWPLPDGLHVCVVAGNVTRSMNMGKHEEPKPQPDPSGDGHKPGQPPPRDPGKHEKK